MLVWLWTDKLKSSSSRVCPANACLVNFPACFCFAVNGQLIVVKQTINFPFPCHFYRRLAFFELLAPADELQSGQWPRRIEWLSPPRLLCDLLVETLFRCLWITYELRPVNYHCNKITDRWNSKGSSLGDDHIRWIRTKAVIECHFRLIDQRCRHGQITRPWGETNRVIGEPIVRRLIKLSNLGGNEEEFREEKFNTKTITLITLGFSLI